MALYSIRTAPKVWISVISVSANLFPSIDKSHQSFLKKFEIGFSHVEIDDSDSTMTMEIPEDVLEADNPNRNRVHVGGEEFEHLQDYDMDKICARVCIVARKPL